MRNIRLASGVFFLLVLVSACIVPGFLCAQKAVQVDRPNGTRVILISVDGLSPRLLQEVHPPNIDALWQNGSYSFFAQTVIPPKTLPAHASMVSGVQPFKHLITWNSWRPDAPSIAVETIFSIADRAGLKTALIASKEKFRTLGHKGYASVFIRETSADDLGAYAAYYIERNHPDLLMVHFRHTDDAGHKYGWYSSEQARALLEIDAAIGTMIETLRRENLLDSTIFIITSDHGGHGLDHGAVIPEDMTIPWIIYGSGIKRGYTTHNIVMVWETAPTVLKILNLPAPPTWDGDAVAEVFESKK